MRALAPNFVILGTDAAAKNVSLMVRPATSTRRYASRLAAGVAAISTFLYNERYIEGSLLMLSFKVTTVGSSAGFILNKEAMAFLKIQKGDTVYLTEAPDGSYRLTPYNPEFERQMSLAEEIMHEDREILHALAK